MRPFSSDVLKPLNDLCNAGQIDYVSLGMHNFNIAFDGVRQISGMFKVNFEIKGKRWDWNEGPIDAPVWLLLGQVPASFDMPDELTLRMELQSGDKIAFHSDVSPYEAVLIEFDRKNDAIQLEVF